MQVELSCSHCRCRFTASPTSSAGEALDRIAQEGPWSAVGDGETLEDRLSAELSQGEPISCPECGRRIELNEENLGRLTRDLLANW